MTEYIFLSYSTTLPHCSWFVLIHIQCLGDIMTVFWTFITFSYFIEESFSRLFMPISSALSYCNISFFLTTGLFLPIFSFYCRVNTFQMSCDDVCMCMHACIGQRRTCENQFSLCNHVDSLNWNYFNRKF